MRMDILSRIFVMDMITLFSAIKVANGTHTEFFHFTVLTRSHQVSRSNMHSCVLNSFLLTDNDERTERVGVLLARHAL